MEAEAAGIKVEKDAFKIVENYMGQITRIHSYMDLVDKAKEFGVAMDIAEEIPEGFVRGKGILSNYTFPTDIAAYLGKYSDTFFNDEAMNYIVKKMVNPFLRWFRTVATVLRPGFHARNVGSDMFNGYLNGNRNPLNYVDSLKALLGQILSNIKIGGIRKLGNKWLDETVTTIAGEKTALRRVVEEGNRRNALGFGWFGAEIVGGGMPSTEPTWLNVLKGLNPLGAESYLARIGKHTGLFGENFSRLSDFINVYKKTGSFDEAARLTKKFHFDYSEQTPLTQNIARKIYPFWTWLWKNTALQFEQILKQPAKFGLIGKVKENIEQLSEDIDENNLQSYVKEEAGIRLPIKTPSGDVIYLRPDLPYQSLFDVTDILKNWQVVYPHN